MSCPCVLGVRVAFLLSFSMVLCVLGVAGFGVIILLFSPERATQLKMHQNFSPALAPTQAPFSNPNTISIRSDSDRIEIHLDLNFTTFSLLFMASHRRLKVMLNTKQFLGEVCLGVTCLLFNTV